MAGLLSSVAGGSLLLGEGLSNGLEAAGLLTVALAATLYLGKQVALSQRRGGGAASSGAGGAGGVSSSSSSSVELKAAPAVVEETSTSRVAVRVLST